VGHRGVNTLCREKDGMMAGGKGGVLRWAGTQEVARDMVGIVNAWEKWVEREGKKVAAEMKGKLLYWGFSYGTYLGATFARMFPDRVGRLLLDGVVDAEFYEAPVWRESLVDADKVLRGFFWYCVLAGKRCDLYRPGDQPAHVKERYDAVMERLKTNPVTFTHPEHFYPVVLRVNLVKMIVFSVLYSPIQGFPALATVLNYIYEAKYELLGPLFQDSQLLCSLAGNPLITGATTDAQRAVMCGDKTQPVSHGVSVTSLPLSNTKIDEHDRRRVDIRVRNHGRHVPVCRHLDEPDDEMQRLGHPVGTPGRTRPLGSLQQARNGKSSRDGQPNPLPLQHARPRHATSRRRQDGAQVQGGGLVGADIAGALYHLDSLGVHGQDRQGVCPFGQGPAPS
jgi:hypothetical protein